MLDYKKYRIKRGDTFTIGKGYDNIEIFIEEIYTPIICDHDSNDVEFFK